MAAIWRFETANLAVTLHVRPEDMDPADSFQFEDDIEAVHNGDVEWFSAEVRVTHKETGAELGTDYLGGCAYKSCEEFRTGHLQYRQGDYFTNMVAEAVARAREALADLQTMKLRKVAA